ncbi:ATP-binding region, ATPase-like:Histidine kinase, HAMP region:Histidine kinase A, N-terminal [Candidatus Accumulibacter aalborgensis]|uniref:histidine kinase n=1 Tax=Candidatus Accumulibacter aalborgensis TaxID=1860102 RepID=A0A1A8XSU3_9PROT|nr:ATP-binding protein [Candidatus Accumulibacter aalborgensis]SBT07013.1 ATP-binding region, ATPase-like:Histidine kinase, HAMP region:Histidine kinase A, N-terminal [Candidatus Accumulibacter aalborgensis]
MDGFKKRLNESVQLKLSVSLSLTILAIALVAGIFSFVSAFDEAHELQDDMLRQIAALFDRQHLPLVHLGDDGRANDSDEESRVIVQYLTAGNKMALKGDAGAPLPLPVTLPDGLHTHEVNGEPFRVLVKTTSSGERIAVAQETGVRDEIARDSALRTLMPFLILVPVLLLIVANLVRKMFRPIAALSAEIDQRAEQELHPVEEGHLPAEVRPFVVAINRLLARVNQSMETQRRFVADAAHELRSPFTALSLQAERLAEADMSNLARGRLMTLRRGIERGRSLLDQLLTLARAQAALDRPKSFVSIQHLYRRVLEDLMPLAEARQIDIGVEGEQDARVWGNELDMMAVVKNLVDNAIRYTPDGGNVDLSVTTDEGRAILRIQDSGPGIQVAERERVFDPFYRTLGSDQVGSGLGLSIVKAIADRIGAEIQLGFSDEVERSGLCVCVRVPLAGAVQEPPQKSA